MLFGNEVLAPENMEIPMIAGKEIEAGSMVMVDGNGYAVAAAPSASAIVAGVAQAYADARSAAADGEISVPIKRAVFLMDVDATVDRSCLLKPCYVSDAHTVTMTAEDAQMAGIIVGFEGDMAAVDMRATVWPTTESEGGEESGN